jgi:5-methylcytosine-specific restriction protein A
MKRSSRPTGPDRLAVDAVWARDNGQCAWCDEPITGERGLDWSVQHRRPRGRGGSRRPDTNLPSNLILLHGNGTTSCHGLVESRRTVAYDLGFLVRYTDSPSQVAIHHAVHGWCFLTDDGEVVTELPPREVA